MQEQGKRPCHGRGPAVLGAEPRFHFELVVVRGMVSVRLVGFGPWFFLLHGAEVRYLLSICNH